ncbi:hotdog fold thioesterase [Teredinibacter waterburyi]|uniref:hotdog fold thioesterase n=1 Tax=Teredinibacter waterburyi TaxID=1500538 RepID=UPI00165FEADC|nr:hotdog fold thioesterase [Teredinibacter waterburyi]
MSLWKKSATPDQLNQFAANCLVGHLQIKVTAIDDNSITATMPVASFTQQPLGFLHGGASVVLAETLGSMAGHLACEEGQICFGVEVNANHMRSVKEGLVTAVAEPLHIGKSMQVWDIKITDQRDQLICVSRLTVAVK